METVSIKVHVTSGTYEKIKSIQQQLRKNEGKMTSLADILLRLAQTSLENLQIEQNFVEKAQNMVNSAHFQTENGQNTGFFAPISDTKRGILSSKGSKYYDELVEKEERLSEREAFIRDRETELFEEREGLLRKRRELNSFEMKLMKQEYQMNLKSYEKNISDMVKNTVNEFNLGSMDAKEVKDNEAISEMKKQLQNINNKLDNIKEAIKDNEILLYSENIYNEIKKLIESVKKSGEKSTWEKYEPLLNVAAVAITNLITNKNKNKNKEDQLTEIKALIGDLKKENKT